MSVYIKGMEMPKTCCYCPLMGYDPDREWFDSMARTGAHICALTGELIDNTKRAEHCPLIPVPEHGDLIDRDALPWEKQSLMVADEDWALPCVLIEDAPTIIPAEPPVMYYPQVPGITPTVISDKEGEG